VDLSRASVRIVMQELIETEAEQRIGAVRHECTAIRVCGSQRLNAAVRWTQAGDVQRPVDGRRAGHSIKRYADSGQTARSWT
jgi:hypothetical protein